MAQRPYSLLLTLGLTCSRLKRISRMPTSATRSGTLSCILLVCTGKHKVKQIMQPIHEKGLPSEPRLLPLYRENSAYCLTSCLVSYVFCETQEGKASALSIYFSAVSWKWSAIHFWYHNVCISLLKPHSFRLTAETANFDFTQTCHIPLESKWVLVAQFLACRLYIVTINGHGCQQPESQVI